MFDGVFILRIASSFPFAGWTSFLVRRCTKEIHCCLLELQLFRVQADIVFASGLEHFSEGVVVLWFG